jgi:5'-3' exonuclease
MDVFLVDGTYELFRHYFAMPKREHGDQEIAATRGVIGSLLGMIDDGAEYLGLATDHVVTSFRNEMWDGYKDGSDMPADILSQFPILEDAVVALGIRLWPMTDLEADDALAAAARSASAYEEVDRVLICSPDKDMAQSVVGSRVVQFDRRQGEVRDADGVVKKFGVQPESIPDYLALVGDSADGFPGLPGWGAKTAAAVLARYMHLESIPEDAADWEIKVRGAEKRAETLVQQRDEALLFRDLATLRDDTPVFDWLEDLVWLGPTPAFEQTCALLDAPAYWPRAQRLAADRSSS